VFTGDGVSSLQIFNVGFDLISSGAGDQELRFEGIPAGASVIVNLTGDARQIRTYTGGGGNPIDALRERLLWNFPDATSVYLSGSAQFPGSVLAANEVSTTTVSFPGINGRMYVAGNLVHTSRPGGGGEELHAYPYRGQLPSCAPVQAAAHVSIAKVDGAGNPLPGATFEISPDPTGGVGTLVITDGGPGDADGVANGLITLETVRFDAGPFTVTETAPPPGYIGDATPQMWDPQPGSTTALTFHNARTRVSLTAEKLDATTGKLIDTAVFQLWRESGATAGFQPDQDTPVGGPKSTQGGLVTWADLSRAVYHVQETQAPDGFELSDQRAQTLDLGGDDVCTSVSVRFENQQATGPTPEPPSPGPTPPSPGPTPPSPGPTPPSPGPEPPSPGPTPPSPAPTPPPSPSEAPSEFVPPCARLVLAKRASHKRVRPGGQIRWTLIAGNRGRGDATNVRLCDSLPKHLGLVGMPRRAMLDNGRLCWNIRRLAAGQSTSLTIRARIDRDAPTGRLRNQAFLRGGGQRAGAHATIHVRKTRAEHLPTPVTG